MIRDLVGVEYRHGIKSIHTTNYTAFNHFFLWDHLTYQAFIQIIL